MQYLKYKQYYGTVDFSLADGRLFGKVVGIKNQLSYEGRTLAELVADFHETVDEYLADCQRAGVTPQRSYKGSFNVRITPALHQQLAEYAAEHDESLNAAVETAIRRLVAEE